MEFGLAILAGIVGLLLYRRRVTANVVATLERLVGERTRELTRANERLQEMSMTDPLTGLRNRRYLYQTIGADLAVTQRTYRDALLEGKLPDGADIVFYVVDMDDFKAVNDRYGHAAGDRVLNQIAHVIQRTVRESDVVARWGGEEFLVVSKQVDRTGSPAFAERLRHAVRSHVFEAEEGEELRRTCSIGFATYPLLPNEPRAVAWEVVMELADQAAFIAKRSGKDAWVGLSAAEGTPASEVRADVSAVALLVERGILEVTSSLEADGREVAPPSVWFSAPAALD